MCAALALFGVAGAPDAASAHHPNATAKVGTTSGPSQSEVGADDVPAPRLDASLAYEMFFFGRVMRGSDDYDRAGLGTVQMYLLSTSLALELASRTRATLRVPVGVLLSNPVDGEAEVASAGMGDMQLTVAQEMRSDRAGGPAIGLRLRGGLVAPTGRYETEESFSLTDIVGSPDGSVAPVTYNTRASLGGDTWSLIAAAELEWDASERVRLQLASTIFQPLTTTSDGIRWGLDGEIGAQSRVAAIPGRLVIGGGIDYRFHGRDQVPLDEVPAMDGDDPGAGDGAPGRESSGGRHELGLGLGISARLTRPLSCAIRVRLPVWQRVSGIQLVETVATTASCSMTLGL